MKPLTQSSHSQHPTITPDYRGQWEGHPEEHLQPRLDDLSGGSTCRGKHLGLTWQAAASVPLEHSMSSDILPLYWEDLLHSTLSMMDTCTSVRSQDPGGRPAGALSPQGLTMAP